MTDDAESGAADRRGFMKSIAKWGVAAASASALTACGAGRLAGGGGAQVVHSRRDQALAQAELDDLADMLNDAEPDVAGLASPAPARRFRPTPVAATRTLTLRHAPSGEFVTAVFRRGDDYDREALQIINYIMRDRRENAVVPIDIRLIELLADLQDDVARGEAINVLSGYRTPRTNYRIRLRNRRAARNSLHVRAMAMDLRIPGVSTRTLRDWGADSARGGVGYYPRRRFVHLDVGDVRYWRF